jgi:DNA-binding GntR family transcriptional regulator
VDVVLTDTQRAYELIKQKIITTEMLPGAVIQEAALMSELGLGRTPIREALKLLEADRLVTVSPRRGMFVTPINISDLAEIQEIRSVLDLLAVRLAALRITPSELTQLRALMEEARATLANAVETPGGPGAAHEQHTRSLLVLDHRFHRLLAESTRNNLLMAETEMLYSLSMRIWYHLLDRVGPSDLALNALTEVVDALEAGDSCKAEQAMSRHISGFGDSLRRAL